MHVQLHAYKHIYIITSLYVPINTKCVQKFPAHRGRRTITLGYKNITLFFLLWVKTSVVRQRQREGGRETVTLTHSLFFSWPYNAVLSSMPCLAYLSLLGRREERYSTGGPLYVIFKTLGFLFRRDVLKRSAPGSRLVLCSYGSPSADSTDRCKLALTDSNSDWSSYVVICIHDFITPTISIQQVTASAYFHRCALCREHLIDGSARGQ